MGRGQPGPSWSSTAEQKGSEGKPDLGTTSLLLLPQKCSDPVVCVFPELVEVLLCALQFGRALL